MSENDVYGKNDPWAVACPICYAPPSNSCTRWQDGSHMTGVHTERLKAAIEAGWARAAVTGDQETTP